MKRSKFITWDQLKVGALILAAIAILTIAIVKLGEAADLFTKRYTLVTFLSNSNGLQKGGTVTLAGQLAGTVKRIDFLPPSGTSSAKIRGSSSSRSDSSATSCSTFLRAHRDSPCCHRATRSRVFRRSTTRQC